MPGELVLITGATGHVGFRVLRYALERGFTVRAAVRSQQKAELIRSKAKQKDERLSFIVVPDFTAPNAFDEAVKGVQYVIHCASPIPFGPPTTDNAREDFIKPAVDVTLELFKSAAKEKGLRRIVVTSSCIAVAPVAAAVSDTGETYTADTRQPEPADDLGPGTISFVAYAAGKVSALNQAEAWVEGNRPHFEVVHLMPSYVIGRNDMCDTTESLMASPNGFVLSVVCGTGEAGQGPSEVAMVVNHIDDCARIHVEALDPRIEGCQSFMICYDCFSRPQWNDAKRIVEERFPEAVKAGILPNKGSLESIWTRLESKRTQEVFGFEHDYQSAVISVVQQYLELHRKEQAEGDRVGD